MFSTEPHVSDVIEVRAVHSALTSFYIRVIGGNPTKIKNTLRRALSKASTINKKVVISYVTEPILFVDGYKKDSENWFEIIHLVCKEFSFPEHLIEFVSGNIYASESYNQWCKQNNVNQKIKVVDLKSFYWISRSIDKGYNKIFDLEPDKHMTLFIGRPRLQKNYVVKWYIDNVYQTERENTVLSTFLYGNFINDNDDWLANNYSKVKDLPGRLEDGSKDHSNVWLNGDADTLNKASCRGLFDFTVDFVEFESMLTYNSYQEFKIENSWWHEDVISEKLFRCILLKKPFIRLGMPHSLKILRDWGFKTFDKILFDEEYDHITDFYSRADCILKQVETLLDTPFEELKEKIYRKDVQEVVEHNYNLAYEIYNKDEVLVNV